MNFVANTCNFSQKNDDSSDERNEIGRQKRFRNGTMSVQNCQNTFKYKLLVGLKKNNNKSRFRGNVW